jgi:2-haloalkanoic acid dehalogenase type II
MALTSTTPSLTTFHALSFDIYGTLIDWSTSLHTAFTPLLSRLPPSHPALISPTPLLTTFSLHERTYLSSHPTDLYPDVLANVYKNIAQEWNIPLPAGEASSFAAAIGHWPPFPDTVAAMQTLGKYYKLIALSNIDRSSFAKTLAGPLAEVHFDAVFTAEEIGSYKPCLRNFEFLIEGVERRFGVGKGELLHVAYGIMSDHVPAREMGLQSAWIARGRPEGERGFEGVEEEGRGRVGFGWRWGSLGEMARDAEEAFSKAKDL